MPYTYPESVTLDLSPKQASEPWDATARISFDSGRATVHAAADDYDALRKAGRSARGMGMSAVAFAEDGWPTEARWAFSRGFETAKGGATLAYDDAELEQRARHFEWAREQVHASPEDLAPERLAQAAADYLSGLSADVSYEVVTGEALVDGGHVGCHEVGRGSDRTPALLKLDFHPGGRDQPVAASLVGKGITFDSGGYSIKASEPMFSMKADMAGAATVAAALGLAIDSGLDRRVTLYLCCAENLISGHAYKLGDIITYPNGLTVEISNTDAEGRIVLADGLLLASADKPGFIIDAATLTGAAYNAVGPDYNAVFSPDPALRNRFLDLAASQNERHWPLPLDDFHRAACPSPYADTMNSRPVKGGGPGGASNAAAFLSRFVPQGFGWVHVDLAAAYHERDTAQYAAGASGQGIRTIAEALKRL